MKTILFVCTGNTCRSSMAEGLSKELLQGKDIQVKSAGTNVFFEEGASKNAIKAMREMGVDISRHVAQPLTEELVEEADLILTMTHEHTDRVVQQYAQGLEKTFTLKEYLSLLLERKGHTKDRDFIVNVQDMDIQDPFGESLEVYRKTAKEIKRIVEKIVQLLD